MKKIFAVFTVLLLSLCLCGIGLASDGADLNKQQQAVVKVLATFNGQNGLEFANISPLLSGRLKTELDERTFVSVKNNLRRSYGEMRENKFLAFQRYADGDRLTYLANYSKDKDLLFVFVFDKQNDLGAFSFHVVN